MTGKSVYVCTDYHEKQLQRALLQYKKPENANLVREALRLAGREDLIGTGPNCLVRPAFGQGGGDNRFDPKKAKGQKGTPSPRTRKTKSTTKAPAPFYQGVVQGKKKKSKLERIFGEEATTILREAESMGEGRKKQGSKPTTKKAKSSSSVPVKKTSPTQKSHPKSISKKSQGR